MVGKKDLLARAMGQAGILNLMKARGQSRVLVAPAFHRVDSEAVRRFSLHCGVLDTDRSKFDAQMELVGSSFVSLTASEAGRMLAQEQAWPARPALVTFDDGYADVVTCALPVLRRHGVKATLFVAPYYVEERDVPWWDWVAHCFHHTEREEVRVGYPERCRFPMTGDGACEAAVRGMIGAIGRARDLDLGRLKAEVEGATGVGVAQSELAEHNIVTWNMLRQWIDEGHEVGAHGMRHRPLTGLSENELELELRESRRLIRERLGVNVETISYPGGATDAHVVRRARAAGYSLGLCYGGKPLLKRASPDARFAVPRQPVKAWQSLDYFHAMMTLPGLFAW